MRCTRQVSVPIAALLIPTRTLKTWLRFFIPDTLDDHEILDALITVSTPSSLVSPRKPPHGSRSYISHDGGARDAPLASMRQESLR